MNLAGGRPFHGCAGVLFPRSVGGDHEAPDQLDRPCHLDSHECVSGSGVFCWAGSVFQLAVCQPDDSWRRAAGFWSGNAALLTIFLPAPTVLNSGSKRPERTWRRSFGRRWLPR